ncbi:MAG: class SAM-dependent methyltransferase [Verrucomicrobiaceae bacterium]|nr:class SAM-dependent methyltransferase [Verrucomicrobiaceae bacterium]
MERIVEPELLDMLPWDHPQARQSRADLRLVNTLMNNSKFLAQQLLDHLPLMRATKPRLRLVEIGAGDGTVLLAVAKRLKKHGISAHVTLIDNQPVFADATREAFADIGWTVDPVIADVLTDLEAVVPEADAVIANMFVHQFNDADLRRILAQVSERTNLLVMCEPRRSRPVLMAGSLLWLLGCCEVTRHDGDASIRAGFRDHELSRLWPQPGDWELMERPANLFNHGFVARRRIRMEHLRKAP